MKRCLVDLAVLGAVFILGMLVFKSASLALLAGIILTGVADVVIWEPRKS